MRGSRFTAGWSAHELVSTSFSWLLALVWMLPSLSHICRGIQNCADRLRDAGADLLNDTRQQHNCADRMPSEDGAGQEIRS